MIYMMKQEARQHPILSTPAATACGNCNLDERRLLHHVRHRGLYRRLCGSCVLRLHPQAFCPSCFLLHDTPNPKGVRCLRCSSVTHFHCAGGGTKPLNPVECSVCANPRAPIFGLKKADESGGAADNGGIHNNDCWTIDKKEARALLTAATIAANSMAKSAQEAKLEADMRAKEAAFARKRAREALEHVSYLMIKEKMRQKEMMLAAEDSGSGASVGVVQVHGKIVSKGGDVSSNVEAAAAQNRISSQEKVDRLGNASEVLAALNAFELREQGSKARNAAASEPLDNGVAMMDVDSKEGIRESLVSCAGASILQNNGSRNENFGLREPQDSENHDAKLQNVKKESCC